MKNKIYLEDYVCDCCGSKKFIEMEFLFEDVVCTPPATIVSCNKGTFFRLDVGNKRICCMCYKLLLRLECETNLDWNDMINDTICCAAVKKTISIIKDKKEYNKVLNILKKTYYEMR